MKKILTIIFIIVITIIIIITIIQALAKSPSNSQLTPTSLNQASPKRLIGFLPYWQTEQVSSLSFPTLDEIIYFGLHINEKGEIEEKDAGFAKFEGVTFSALQTQNSNKTVSVAIILQDNEKIELFLANLAAQERLIQTLETLIAQKKFSGINLDFEYAGIPNEETIGQYANFVADFTTRLKTKHPHLIISVDVTADAIKKSRLYDVEKLAQSVDYVVLMGYDFYRPTSSVAGPVAPLTGKEIYEYDVTSAVADFLLHVPNEKLVLGVPYYGWDFPTIDNTRGSFVAKRPDETVALSSYRRNQRLIKELQLPVLLDEESQTPWMLYHDPDTGGIRQIWFENVESIGKKYDLVNNRELAGIAIWALGYDGNHPELWNLLREKFGK